jgi:hypothetical protein
MAMPDAEQPTLGSGTVRMSFTTDRPFFPYSEPADQRDGNADTTVKRLLRVYCVSDSRMDGTLDSASVQWPGKTRWAEPLPSAIQDQVAGSVMDLFGRPVPPAHWLTTFEDTSSPRPGVADLYFTPAARQTPLVPTVLWPEDRRMGVPVELLVVGMIVAVNRIQRRRQARSAGTVA